MTTTELSAELKAMADIEAALKNLSDEERARVMQWAASRFRGPGKSASKVVADDNEVQSTELGKYGTLAEFYDAAAPETDADRALVAAYWYQFKEDASEVEAQKINRELKHLGHGVGNITRAFEALKSQKPALIMQTRKEGSTKQARKRYKVTTEGKRAVERMIARNHE